MSRLESQSLLRPTVDRGARWSVEVRDVGGDRILAPCDADVLVPTVANSGLRQHLATSRYPIAAYGEGSAGH